MNFNINYIGKSPNSHSYTIWNINDINILFRSVPKKKMDDVEKVLEILSENLKQQLPIGDAIKLLPYPQFNILILIKHLFIVDFLKYIESYLSNGKGFVTMYDFYIKELGFDTNERGIISTLTISKELSELNDIVCGWITDKVDCLNIERHLKEGKSTGHIADSIGPINFVKLLYSNHREDLVEYIDKYFENSLIDRKLPAFSDVSRLLVNHRNFPDNSKLDKEGQEFVTALKVQFNSMRPFYGSRLIEGNIKEMDINKDQWKIYALCDYAEFASKNLDFSGIQGEKFKKEIKWFYKEDALDYVIEKKSIDNLGKRMNAITSIVNYLHTEFNIDGFAEVDSFLAQLVKRFLMFETYDERTGEPLKTGTMSSILTEIRKIVNHMIENKLPTSNHPIPIINVFDKVKFYNRDKMADTMDVIPDVVLDKLESKIQELDIIYQRIFSIFIGTGMRAKEIIFLEKDCLDYSYIDNPDVNKRGIILRYTPYKVLISQTKRNKEKHEIYIQPELAEIIEQQIKETEWIREKYIDVPYIFIGDVCEKVQMKGRNFTANINKLIRKYNICDVDNTLWAFDSRQMRPTVVCNMIENGACENEILSITNHTNVNTLRKFYEKLEKLKLANLNEEFFKKQFELEVGAENLKAFDEEERRILAYQFATREREVEFGQCVKHDSEGKCKRGGEYACANCNKICTGKQYLPKWESLYNNQLDIVRDLETEYNNDEISKEEYSEYIEYIREVKQLNYYKNVIEKIKDRG